MGINAEIAVIDVGILAGDVGMIKNIHSPIKSSTRKSREHRSENTAFDLEVRQH
jgi:hypothetical protein